MSATCGPVRPYLVHDSTSGCLLDGDEGLQVVGGHPVREKAFRHRFSAPDEYTRKRHPVAMRDAVHPPLIDRISLDDFASGTGEKGGNAGAAAKTFDQFGVSMHKDSVGNSFRVVKPAKSEKQSQAKNPASDKISDVTRKQQRNPYNVACGLRLGRVRLALGYKSIQALCDAFELPHSRVNKWHSGDALVPPEFINELSERHDDEMLLPYIYKGDRRYMSAMLKDKLDAITEREESRSA